MAWEKTEEGKTKGEAAENARNPNGSDEELSRYLFPHAKLRDVQRALVVEVANAVSEKRNMIIHAPTGLGKTAATLSPALKYAIDHKKKVFFLTSRHTQHMIAIETLREIKKKYDIELLAVDLIGKKNMCTVPGIEMLHSGEFYEYCKKQRTDGVCEQFSNTKSGSKLTTEAKLALEKLRKESPCHIEQFSELCGKDNLCAYELAATLAKEAHVIVADYYYIYNDRVRESLFNRAGIELADCIVIVDEGHNLPDRIRILLTAQLSNYTIKRAINEAKKINNDDAIAQLAAIQDVLNELSSGLRDGDEKAVTKEEFAERICKIGKYDDVAADLEFAGTLVRDKERQSSIGAVAEFLNRWTGSDDGYVRIIAQKQTKRESVVFLSYRCLDPSIAAQNIIKSCHSTIIMSGTLTPTEMYKDVLGFPDDTIQRRYKSQFPDENRLALIVPETTTKFSMRNPLQYQRIADICADITNTVPGNCAIFFPSYFVRDNVYKTFYGLSKKTAFVEKPDMEKEEKTEFLERFKAYRKTGAVMLGAITGSYGEGIDLPGDLLNCVIVVGLPLQQPSLEIQALIKYYEAKFGKGWDYGYVGPAFFKCLQSAGRCIRSETDRGVIAFLDERYVWQNYYKHFPADMNIAVTKDYAKRIKEFYGIK